MKISHINLLNVMSHKDTSVRLPDTGVVLVTGPNGAGKSALAEGVAVALWDQPLRKKPIWNTGAPLSRVEVCAEKDLVVCRERKNKGAGKTTLEFAHGSEHPVKYETATKAQAELDQMISSYQLWRRTSMFSSSDVDVFTQATDGARKKMLEDLLGLEIFDKALTACRADSKIASVKMREGIDASTATNQRVRTMQERYQDACDQLDALPDPRTAPPRVKDDSLKTKKTQLKNAQQAEGKAGAAVELAQGRVREIKRAMSGAKTKCGECGAPLDTSHLAALPEKLKAAEAEFRAAEAVYKALPPTEELEDEIEELQRQAGGYDALLNEIAREDQHRKELEESKRTRAAKLEDLRDEHDEAKSAMIASHKECALLSAVDDVLSLRGVRAHMLADALRSVEQIANNWLAKLTDGYTLKLSSYTEKSSGELSDAISLSIEGLEHSHGYGGASGGQRRRIDIALMLALAEIAEYASGRSGGTIFMDECMDAIDSAGVPLVVELLQELAQTRCVVVITHNDDLAQSLNPAVHLHVDNGVVTSA